jgi:hypothetical protein
MLFKIQLLELKITKLGELLTGIRSATRAHAVKQQTRSSEEKETELRNEEFGLLPVVHSTEEGLDQSMEPIYNPLNLPIGWDGKPIPYWLYKLHGLGTEFKCEIW